MSDIQMLRLFVNERISSVAEEILNVFIKTLLQYQQQIELQRKQLDLVDPSDVKTQASDVHRLPVEEEELPLPPERWEERSSSLSQEKKDPKCPPPHRKDTELPVASSSTEGHDVKTECNEDEVEFCAASRPPGHLEPTLNDRLFSSDRSEAQSEEEEGDANDGNSKDTVKTWPESPHPSPVGDRTSAGSPVEAKSAGETESRCKVCRQSFPDAVSLRRHVRFHHGDCGLCGKHLEPTENLKLHLQVHRTCTACGKAFPTNSALEKHTRTHTGEKPYGCAVCQQRFTESGTLKIHMRGHTGERPFDCKFCGKGFSRQANLNAHVRVHTGEKPFACAVCDQRFCRSQYLKIHMRRHMGEKPFGCAVCAKRFANNETLKGHMRSHTGEKPFACAFCQKGFSLRENLKVHLRVHTGEKPFACAFCQKGFSLRENLKVHMRVHTGEKPYGCTLCRQSFRRKESLKAHVTASHAEVRVEVESS